MLCMRYRELLLFFLRSPVTILRGFWIGKETNNGVTGAEKMCVMDIRKGKS
jgi:hypothetical protein